MSKNTIIEINLGYYIFVVLSLGSVTLSRVADLDDLQQWSPRGASPTPIAKTYKC
jgi:hypothetical protein